MVRGTCFQTTEIHLQHQIRDTHQNISRTAESYPVYIPVLQTDVSVLNCALSIASSFVKNIYMAIYIYILIVTQRDGFRKGIYMRF